MKDHFDGLVQERRNSCALAVELHLSCTNLSTCPERSQNVVVALFRFHYNVENIDAMTRSFYFLCLQVDISAEELGNNIPVAVMLHGHLTSVVSQVRNLVSTVLCLTHWGRDKMAAFSQTTLSNAFSWMKLLEFRLKFHWSLFLRVLLTIFQHWLR